MSEKTEIISKSVGFSWKYSVESEVRKAGADSKYSDKDMISVSVGGNCDSFDEMFTQLNEAKAKIREVKS